MAQARADETLLHMIERHVREGNRHLTKQHEIIARLRSLDLPTETAELLLIDFERYQAGREAHLRQVLAEQRIGSRDAEGSRIFSSPHSEL